MARLKAGGDPNNESAQGGLFLVSIGTWGVERRGPGRTKEDRRREQLEREAQGNRPACGTCGEAVGEETSRAPPDP